MRGRRSRLVLSLLCVCFCVAAGVYAQQPSARKIDEFGRLYGCDGGARLDNFAYFLLNEPGAKGYIIARDARGVMPGAAHFWGNSFLHYLSELRGIDQSRLVLVDGAGVSGDDLKMELWLVPEGAAPPRVRPAGKEAARPFHGKYAEFRVVDDRVFYDVEGPRAGSFGSPFMRRAFAELLKKQPDSQGYLVVYSPPGAAPGYWRRAGSREQQKFSWVDIPADRLTLINGGCAGAEEETAGGEEQEAEGEESEEEEGEVEGAEIDGRVELWVGAKGKPPVRHVEEEAALTEATLVGDLSFWSDNDEVRAWAMNNLADVMRGDRRALGCVVVYPGDNSQVGMDGHGNKVPLPDIFKLAETWKAEFLKRHGFEPHRLVVINGPAESSSAGRIEAWAVPHGAPLPDPFAKAGEGAGEEEEEGGGEEQPPA